MWLATALWILPSVCQISTFSLIVLYYAKLVNRTQWHQRKGFLISCYVVGNTLMVLLTIVISGLTDVESRSAATQEIENGIALLDKMFFVSSGTYFGLLLILAGFYVYKLWQLSRVKAQNSSESLLHRREKSRFGSGSLLWLSTFVIFLIFLSRCIYDFLAAFKHGVITSHVTQLTDAGKKTLPVGAFVLFFVWEILPTIIVLLYFRHIPRNTISVKDRFLAFFRECWYRDRHPSMSESEFLPNSRVYSITDEDFEVKEDLVQNEENNTSNNPRVRSASQSHRYESVGIYVGVPQIRECFDDPRRYDSDTDIVWKTGTSGSSGTDHSFSHSHSYILSRSGSGPH